MKSFLKYHHKAVIDERYIVEMVQMTRHRNEVAVGASPRGSLALLKLARSRAAMQNREFILPDDIKALVIPALSHRLILQPDLWMKRYAAANILDDIVQIVSVPVLN